MGGLRRREGGFVLLDAIAALAVVAVGLAVFLGSLATAGRLVRRHAAGVRELVEVRNREAQDRTVDFPAP